MLISQLVCSHVLPYHTSLLSMHNADLKTHLYLIHYGTWMILSGILRNTTSLHIIRTCQGKSSMSASEPPTMCWSTETARATGSRRSRNILSVAGHWSKKWCLLAPLHTLYSMLRECLISLYTVCGMYKSSTSTSADLHRRVTRLYVGVNRVHACLYPYHQGLFMLFTAHEPVAIDRNHIRDSAAPKTLYV